MYLPICLGVLLPHDVVELVVVLVAEDESHVVVIDLGVHEEGALEVDPAEPVEPDRQPRVRVHRLYDLSTLNAKNITTK